MGAMARHFLQTLYCSDSGESVRHDRLQGLSPGGHPLLTRYDIPAIGRAVTPEMITRRPRGMWRWRELLPLDLDLEPVSLGEGDTPLLPAPRLAAELGLERLWIKDESLQPTGSFKARGLSAAVTMGVALGARAFIVPSAGNAGGALAAYAARAGVPAHVFVPVDTPVVNQREVLLYGGNLVRIEGLIDDCGAAVAERKAELDAFDVSTLKEPYRLEGKKTLGLEIAEQLGWRVPDVIVYPTGGGTGLLGMRKAFDELAELGWIDPTKRPRFVCVQPTGCAPIVRAFSRGEARAERWSAASTRAYGLRVPRAIGDALILQTLRDTRGTAVSIEDARLLEDVTRLGALEGTNACPEGGACVSAIAQLRTQGWISPTDEVLFVNTGAGTKYVDELPPVHASASP